MTAATPPTRSANAGGRIVSIASGKGGVGKTNVAVGLALALGRAGKRTCLMDADLGLSNVDILLDLAPKRTLEDVLFNDAPVEDTLIPIEKNVSVLPGGSGVQRLASLDKSHRTRLVEEFSKLHTFDYLLVDNSPGIIPPVISLCLSSREAVILVTPEAASITDAYALIKVLKENGLWYSPMLLINRVRSPRQGQMVFERMRDTARDHLDVRCRLLGFLPEDPAVMRSGLLRQPVQHAEPDALFSRYIRKAAERLVQLSSKPGHEADPGAFIDQSVTRFQLAAPPQSGPWPFAESPDAPLQAIRDEMAAALETLETAPIDVPGSPAHRAKKALRRADQIWREHFGDGPGTDRRPTPPHRGTVRIICQQPGLLELLQDLVESVGFTALPPGEPPAGDIALTLVSPDHLDREELMEQIRSAAPGPVLLLLGYGDAARLDGAPLPPSTTMLHKPFSVSKFLETARRLAEGREQ